MDAIPGIPFVMNFDFDCSAINGIGRLPHLLRVLNELEFCQSTQQRCVVRANQNRIMPAARADEVGVKTRLTGPVPMSCKVLHLAEIFLADGQVGGVECKTLASTALD